jgi:hypothetical protein
MVELDTYDCPVEGCSEAYPHSLLTDKHVVDEHADWLDELIDGNRRVAT